MQPRLLGVHSAFSVAEGSSRDLPCWLKLFFSGDGLSAAETERKWFFLAESTVSGAQFRGSDLGPTMKSSVPYGKTNRKAALPRGAVVKTECSVRR